MSATLSIIAGLLLKLGVGLLVINEIRGLVLAAPVLYAMYEAGGTAMAIWIGFCSLAGVGQFSGGADVVGVFRRQQIGEPSRPSDHEGEHD